MDSVPTQAPLARQRLEDLQALATAVARASGEAVIEQIVAMLARSLGVRFAAAAVFADETRAQLRTLAAVVEGESVIGYDYAQDGSPCFSAAAEHFVYVAEGGEREFAACSRIRPGLTSYAAYPLRDRVGQSLGVLVVADGQPVAGGDAAHAEAMLTIVAARLVGEVERARTDEVLQAIALAVSKSRSDSVFDELVQLMATVLGVEVAFVARYDAADPGGLTMLSMYFDGQLLHNVRYALHNTPCETVLGQRLRVYPRNLQTLFPDDVDTRVQCSESYAGHPLVSHDGAPLGLVAVVSRRPMLSVQRVEALLKIFAVRAGAELERASAREALDRSEASYRSIFDAAEDAIFIHDWDTSAILEVNRKACEVFGYSRHELLRLSIGELSSGEPPYTAEDAARHIRLAKIGRCEPFEWHRRSKDGSLHWDEVSLKPATIGGRPHLLAFTHEITDRKQALEQLQQREEQYRTIFESSSDGLFLWDHTLCVVDVNPAGLAFYGYTREQIVGRAYGEWMPKEYVQERLELVRRALAGETTHIETRALRTDGTWFDADLRVMPFMHRGHPHALAVVRDISERRRRERELQRSEARLRATVEAAFDCIIAIDEEGRVVEFNSAAERVFGYCRTEALGQKLSGLIVPPRLRTGYERGIMNLRRGSGVGRLMEMIACRADGTEFPVELAVSVAEVPEGSIYVGHLRDISARRTAEAQRSALEAQLRQAQKMEAVGQLTGGIAHDFNNILTSVMGYVLLGQERAEALGDPTLSRQLGQAQLAAQRARDLIAQMLAFARRQQSDRRPLELQPLARQTLQLLRSTLPTSITVRAQGLEPETLPPLFVSADSVQLEQILFNLCINARDAMDGAGTITVRVGRVLPGDWHCASCRMPVGEGAWVELRVSDTGRGIASEHQDRIFDPFFSTKPPGQGSGMGLAMVHGIVHEHGGHIVMETAPGLGTSFSVLLPQAQSASRDPGDLVEPRLSSGERIEGDVLLVEDDVLVGDYLREQLSSWGLNVILMRDPAQAIVWLRDGGTSPGLVLTDLTMPRMTGLQLAREVQRVHPGMPVLLATGHGGDLDAAEVQASGVRQVLKKPLDVAVLKSALRTLLAAVPL